MPQAAYQPLPASSAAAIGDIGSCAFVTAGPRSYLPAISCVSTRLKALGSRYPLLIFVQPEDESYMRTQLRDVRDGKVLAWNSFPTSASSRVHPARIMDKLNLLGAPIKRLVWIDADMYVRHNIDELCELPENIEFAATINAAGGRPSYVWPSRFTPRRLPCVHGYNASADGKRYTFLRPGELLQPHTQCPFMLNSGLLVLRPLSGAAFERDVVQPMRSHVINTYDGGDQGIFNTLLYGERRQWGDRWAVLHPRFNVIAHSRFHAERHWNGIESTVVHWTGMSGRPWNLTSRASEATKEAAKEWREGCGASAAGQRSGESLTSLMKT